MNKTKIRPSYHGSNEITFLWTPGEKLVELVHTMPEGLQFAVREGVDNPVRYQKEIESYTPVAWLEQYIGVGALRLASAAADSVVLDDLAEQIRNFIHCYFDCDPQFESVAVLYALHTWVYEKFHAVPYLRFLGLPGSGKTRATEVIGAMCYRPLVMAGSTTPAPMFRMIESIGGTLLIDEADFAQSQVGTEIAKVLNCGYQQGLPVTRMDKNEKGEFVPRIHEVFGPKIINGRTLFRDQATESRCISYAPLSTDRADIPVQLPPRFSEEAEMIQNQALGWRMANLDSFEVREIPLNGLKGRTKQITIPLVSVTHAMSKPVGERYRKDLLEYCAGMEAQAKVDRSDTVEGKLVSAFVNWSGKGAPTCKQLAAVVTADNQELRWLTPNRASSIVRSIGFETQHTKHGSVVRIEPKRLGPLCDRFGLSVPAHGDAGDDGDAVGRVEGRNKDGAALPFTFATFSETSPSSPSSPDSHGSLSD